MREHFNDPKYKKINMSEFYKLGDCQMCAGKNATINYMGVKICQDCYDSLTTTEADKFENRLIEDTIHTIDVGWTALKAQLKCNNPNKNELKKLQKCMVDLLEHLITLKT